MAHGTVKKKSNRISITFFWLELISWHEPCFKPAMSSLFKKIYCPFSNIWPINNQFPKSSFLVGQKWLIFLHTYLVLLFCIYRYIFEFLVLNNRGYKTEEPKNMSDYNDVSFLQKFENLNWELQFCKPPLAWFLDPYFHFLASTHTQSLGTNEQLLKGFKNHTQEWLLWKQKWLHKDIESGG